MFDPAQLGASLQPGDKVAMTFHKGQPKASKPTFMDNVHSAGASAAGPGVPAPIGAAGDPSLPNGPMGMPPPGMPPDPMAQRQALMQAMRQRMALGRM